MQKTSPLSAWIRREWHWIQRYQPSEILLLAVALVLLLLGYGFTKLADSVNGGRTQSIDEWILRGLRQTEHPAIPVGPRWVREAALDLTALGSPAVLLLMLAAVVGLMALLRKPGMVVITLVTTGTEALLAGILKYYFVRERPTIVPHLREVTSTSFPSAHAMLSAVVYLTLGILLMQVLPGRAVRVYCLFWAMLLTFLVGSTRVYLGVHYPTDVLAGWIAGGAWALACWAAVQIVAGARSSPPEAIDK